MKYLLILLLILTGCSTHLEQPRIVSATTTIPGHDVLALAKYCNTYLKASKLQAVSSLLTSFGDPMPCIEKRILQGGITDVQIDIRDATCFRNKVCPAGTPRLTDWRFLQAGIQKVNAYAVRHPNVTWWISPWLEYDIKEKTTVQKGVDMVRQYCPSCKPILSPFTGVTVPGVPVEKHGTKVSAFSVSGDGASFFDGDNIQNDGNNFQHRLSGLYTTFGWINEFNLRCTGEKNFTPIPKRTTRPRDWQFKVMHKSLTTPEDPIPAVPPTCRTVIDVVSPQITKPAAEAYCNGVPADSRGNKPLLILNRKGRPGERLHVLRPDGRRVACFRYYGPFSDPGMYRYYIGDCSGQNAWELYQLLGNEWGYLQTGEYTCVRFNSLRRQGKYR